MVDTASLRHFPWLAGLSVEELGQIAEELDKIELEEGEILFHEGRKERSLYLLSQGELEIWKEWGSDTAERIELISGRVYVGEFQLLVGGRRTATVRALHRAVVFEWDYEHLERWMERYPSWVEMFSRTVLQRVQHNQLYMVLARLFGGLREEVWRDVQARAKWVHLERGQRLFQQGDPGDGVFLVVSGRLRIEMLEDRGKIRSLGEIRRGELLGELGFFSNAVRAGSALALRESHLVHFSQEFFEEFLRRHPHEGLRVMQAAVRRLRSVIKEREQAQSSRPLNVAILPLDRGMPYRHFVRSLVESLSGHGDTCLVDRAHIAAWFGNEEIASLGLEDPYSLRLNTWLTDLAGRHRFVVYVMDSENTPWTQRCLQMVDVLLLVAEAGAEPKLRDAEQQMFRQLPENGLERRLILLHPKTTKQPHGTAAWLKDRHLEMHHHVRWGMREDMDRLARFLAGEAIGLVMGGGGVRGFVHYGTYAVFRKAGIPIDFVGGTSMGAIVGAQCVLGTDRQTFLERSEWALVKRRPFQEYTLPLMSLIRSRRLDKTLKHLCEGVYIEDLWLPFFAVSSNLSRQSVHVHRQGLLWRALRASSALPGLLLPQVEDGEMLVDGALLNNLPVDVMRRYCRTVLAVEVTGETEFRMPMRYFPSPWWLLWQKLRRNVEAAKVPTIMGILSYATMLAGLQHVQRMIDSADYCLRPPVSRYDLLSFRHMGEILELGELFAQQYLEQHPEMLALAEKHGD
ncbi:MAG: cyclic nucleotide-binding domain-containing protein [Myxococcales bacterium]|nr:cyclic nucleotide-binding domain-containing protein [Myxococcales bacterium]